MSHKQRTIAFLTAFIILAIPFWAWERQGAEKKSIQIPFQSIEGWVVVPVKINGSRDMNMILDTGMPMGGAILLRPELGEEIGLNYTGKTALGGAGSEGVKSGNISMGASLSLPGMSFTNQRIITFAEPIQTITPVVDGIIGGILFQTYAVEVDFDRSLLTVLDPSDYTPDGRGQVLPLMIRNGYPYLETSLLVDGKANVRVNLVVDLGARHALSLYLNEKKAIAFPGIIKRGIIGSGVAGDVYGHWGRISQLNLGSFELKDVITSFPDGDETMGISHSQSDGNLGSQILRKFNVVFDYSRASLWLEPNSSFSKPFEFNMAGLLLRSHLNGNRLVYDVLSDSPGEKADIRKGDILISINGRDTSRYTYSEVIDLFRQRGKKIRVTVLRGSEEIKKNLVLKRLF